ncbi:MAG: 2TM domain-containing protein [Acidimicrobiales bacterium]
MGPVLEDLRSSSEEEDEEEPSSQSDGEEQLRQQAIRRIGQRRHFHVELVVSGVAMFLLVLVWAASEYHDAGGWPTGGFSQSSGIPNVWNLWIVYPLVAWVLIMGARAWRVYRNRPISEGEIEREIERMRGRGR